MKMMQQFVSLSKNVDPILAEIPKHLQKCRQGAMACTASGPGYKKDSLASMKI